MAAGEGSCAELSLGEQKAWVGGGLGLGHDVWWGRRLNG